MTCQHMHRNTPRVGDPKVQCSVEDIHFLSVSKTNIFVSLASHRLAELYSFSAVYKIKVHLTMNGILQSTK